MYRTQDIAIGSTMRHTHVPKVDEKLNISLSKYSILIRIKSQIELCDIIILDVYGGGGIVCVKIGM